MTTNGAGATDATIAVRNVSKWYGDVVSVNDVSFDVYPGVTGLLGPNGAGKTTLLRMINGLAEPSGGSVTVQGEAVRNNPGIYRRIGVMPEQEAVYPFLTGRQFVELNAKLQGVTDIASATDRAIGLADLADAQGRAVGGYSRGMRQRIRLAAAVVHDPPVLLLDEPLSGADPRQRMHFQETIRRLGAEGRTIVISSHILEEVEVMADQILLILAGKLAAAGDYRSIREKLNERPFMVKIGSSDSRSLAAGLVRLDTVVSVEVDGDGAIRLLSRDVRSVQQAVPKIARDLGVTLFRFEPLDDSLESVFSYLTER